jgi:hypothetical protein
VIPSTDPKTGLLPPGVHEASWADLVDRYGYSPHRQALLTGLEAGLDALRRAGCRRVYIDGSFVAAKDNPGDFDACWESAGVNGPLLDPVLLTFGNGRAAQKARYGGEFFIAEGLADPHGARYLEFFQYSRDGIPKGIIALTLGGLP